MSERVNIVIEVRPRWKRALRVHKTWLQLYRNLRGVVSPWEAARIALQHTWVIVRR